MPQADTERFVQLLTENQNRIFGYVFSLLGDHSRTADVVQEVNLLLWRKIEEFDHARPFLPWAFSIARFQVLSHLRDRNRDRLLLDPELAETLSCQAESKAGEIDAVRAALRPCLQLLTPNNRTLIEHRYFQRMPLAEIADTADRTVGSIKVALLRIRRQLAECVQKRMATEG